MRISRCRLHQLELPFRMRLTHASASRTACDSLIVELEAGGHRGYGEAVLREYVGGLPPGPSLLEAGRAALVPMIRQLLDASWEEARAWIETAPVSPAERPLLGAVEAALMDIHCRDRGVDVFALIGEPPRSQVRYGAVLPIAPAEVIRPLLDLVAGWRLSSLRMKLGEDLGYNDMILALARGIVGAEATLRADVNSAWGASTIRSHLVICHAHGVRFVEDPAPERDVRESGVDSRFVFVADEAFVTEADLDRIAAERLYGMLNIRLSKNGGVLRALALARRAAALGLAHCLGSHLGETGILSSLGRTAAALMDDPAFVDGSYDSQVLSDNITTVNFDFGPGGWASVNRDQGVGYTVDSGKLLRYTASSAEVALRP